MDLRIVHNAMMAKVAAKKTKAEEVDLGDGWSYDCSSPEDYAAAERIKDRSRVMGFGDAMIDSAPVALLAAAIGGVGSLALSRGSLEAAGIGAALSGAGTLAWNGIGNIGKRKMSVEEAISKELQNA